LPAKCLFISDNFSQILFVEDFPFSTKINIYGHQMFGK